MTTIMRSLCIRKASVYTSEAISWKKEETEKEKCSDQGDNIQQKLTMDDGPARAKRHSFRDATAK